MNKIQETFLRVCLKPAVTSNLPGRLRLKFSKYKMLPKEAEPYLHYANDVMAMLPGVKDSVVNARIGTALILYNPQMVTAKGVLRWIDTAVDVGIGIVNEIGFTVPANTDEEGFMQIARERLARRLPLNREEEEHD